MNYRHAFHAGNFADCLKHAVIHWMFTTMARKPGAVFILDTHAGAGQYRLDEDALSGSFPPAHGAAGTLRPAAQRTGEYRDGIARLLAASDPVLTPWLGCVRDAGPGVYPGSPALLRALMRPQDRMACCELHPEDHAALRRLFRADPLVGVHARDGWQAIGALLPPRERRALVLIDPPYEQPNEIERLAHGLATAQTRLPSAVLAGWFPIKHMAPVHALRAAIQAAGLRDAVEVSLCLRPPLDPARLNGAGMVLVNPPFGWDTGLAAVLAALAEGLDADSQDAETGGTMRRLTDE